MHGFDILLVDDEERFLQTTRRLLTRRGYSVIASESGAEALEVLDRHQVRIVVLDVQMPGINGLQILKTIKQEYPLVEVIMLTGHATVDSAVEGLNAGAIDYLMKPIDIDILATKIDELLEQQNQMKTRTSTEQA